MNLLKQSFTVIENDKNTYHNWIDFFRFIAAFAVFIYHYPHFYHIGILDDSLFKDKLSFDILPFYDYLKYFYMYGNRGVDFFWVISGFIFSAVYFNKSVVASKFWISRFARLYPLHFVTLIFISILQLISIYSYNEFQIIGNNDLYHFFLNLFFISSWGFQVGTNFNWPIWSVSIELIIYFVFFNFMPKLFSKGILKSFLLLLVFTFLYFINNQLMLLNNLIFLCGFYFFAGSCMYFIRTLLLINRLSFLIPLIAIIISVIGYYTIGSLLNNHDIYIFPALVLLVSYFDIKFKNFGEKLSFLGNLCYSLYLWHMPLQILIMIFYLNTLSLEKRFEVLNSEWFIIVFLLFSILISIFSYKYIENPSRKAINLKLN